MRVRAHVGLQRSNLFASANALEHVTQALGPGDGAGGGGDSQLLRVDPLGEFRKHRRNVIEPTSLMLVTDEVNRRRFRR